MALTLGAGLGGLPAQAESSGGEWSMSGHDLANSRSNPDETVLGPESVTSLTQRWTATTAGNVSATPAVAGGAVYFPDWGGKFWKLDATTGEAIWSRDISEYNGVADSISRSSPTVSGDTVYLGDQSGAHLFAVDTASGDLRWSTQLDTHQAAILTQSPAVADGVVYQGVSSREEGLAADGSYKCCTFRGSLVALDAASGTVLWKTYMVPDNGGVPGGYSGNAIWSGMPAVDRARHTVYVTTGNNYTMPAEAKECQEGGGKPEECMDPANHLDSLVALDTATGKIRWATGTGRFDDWTVACNPFAAPNNCPQNPGEDADFGDGAHLFTVTTADGGHRDLVGAGQKSGEYWAVDADTGEIVWSAAPGPGGELGGIEWGTATDGERIYLAEANSSRLRYTLPDGQKINYSSFAALDPATGKILWQVPDPHKGRALAAVTVANGVLYAGNMDGWMYAFDASSGKLLWSLKGEGSCNAGAAVADGTVYWGNGYDELSTTFYAFSTAH